jgi:hypothetical protein
MSSTSPSIMNSVTPTFPFAIGAPIFIPTSALASGAGFTGTIFDESLCCSGVDDGRPDAGPCAAANATKAHTHRRKAEVTLRNILFQRKQPRVCRAKQPVGCQKAETVPWRRSNEAHRKQTVQKEATFIISR